jgi:hypothetical protein
MNYAQIKQNLISLGFAEETDYEEFEDLGYTYDAINRSISQIGNEFPYIKTYEFEIDDSDEGILYVDMPSIDETFLSFAETPVLFEKDGEEFFKKFSGYEIEMDRNLVVDADEHKGSFRVYYNALCTQINSETPDTYIPEIPLKVHHLIPLLAAYYLWLDDDATKAAQYYNMYETELGLVMQKEKAPRMRVVTDWASGKDGFPLISDKSEWRY